MILTRRRPAARARPGECDVSVVEGMHVERDRSSAGSLDVVATAVRGCMEELGIQVGRSDVHLLGLAADMTYHQWSFLGLVPPTPRRRSRSVTPSTPGIAGKGSCSSSHPIRVPSSTTSLEVVDISQVEVAVQHRNGPRSLRLPATTSRTSLAG